MQAPASHKSSIAIGMDRGVARGQSFARLTEDRYNLKMMRSIQVVENKSSSRLWIHSLPRKKTCYYSGIANLTAGLLPTVGTPVSIIGLYLGNQQIRKGENPTYCPLRNHVFCNRANPFDYQRNCWDNIGCNEYVLKKD